MVKEIDFQITDQYWYFRNFQNIVKTFLSVQTIPLKNVLC